MKEQLSIPESGREAELVLESPDVEPKKLWLKLELEGQPAKQFLELQELYGATTYGETVRRLVSECYPKPVAQVFDFGRAKDEMLRGFRVRRRAWSPTHFLYIDARYPDRIQKIYDKADLTDEDLLAVDYERVQR